jgi:hypothetical protein
MPAAAASRAPFPVFIMTASFEDLLVRERTAW